MIYLVRHGETDWNLFKRCNGVTDTFLNHTGIAQARRQAENLKHVRFDACFCSPQIRARQFCEIVYSGPIVFDDRLAEINCGEFEGMEETAEMMKQMWRAAQNGDKGMERMDAFIKRNCAVCDVIAAKRSGENVLIVTHAMNTRVIDYYFTGKPKDYDFNKRVMVQGEMITYEN